MAKVQFEDKVKLYDEPDILEINKITDENVNELKSVVNENDDDFQAFLLNTKVQNVTETGTNLNDYKEQGVYFFRSTVTPTNIPGGAVNGWLQVISSDEGFVKQIFYRAGTANSNDFETYVRTYTTANVWSDWKRYLMVEENSSYKYATRASSLKEGECKYFEYGNLVVANIADVTTSTNITTNGTTLFSGLPKAKSTVFFCLFRHSSITTEGSTTCRVRLDTDGTIKTHYGTVYQGSSQYYGTITYFKE